MFKTSFQRLLLKMGRTLEKEQPNNRKIGIYIFGTGQGGMTLFQHLKKNNTYDKYIFEVKGFFDNKIAKDTVAFIDDTIITPPNKESIGGADFVFIASYTYQFDMHEQLVSLGIDNSQIILPKEWLNEVLTNKTGDLFEELELLCACCGQPSWVLSDKTNELYYFCENCRSFPWHRALINQIQALFGDDLRKKSLYEVAPHGASSNWLEKNAGTYTASHYWPDIPFGSKRGSYYSQNLEALTFQDDSFDVVVTQVVFEHIFNPEAAFKEIARVLKPGGCHIFSIPFFPGTRTTVRAKIDFSGKIEHIKDPIYHGNPISADGALVTIDWGDDIDEIIYGWTGMKTNTYVEQEKYNSGITAYSYVFVSKK